MLVKDFDIANVGGKCCIRLVFLDYTEGQVSQNFVISSFWKQLSGRDSAFVDLRGDCHSMTTNASHYTQNCVG